jgi:hypothetical protein
MKKSLILLLAFAFFGFNYAIAQQATEVPADKTTMVETNDTEKEIAVAELPEAVQTALNADEYQGWNVAKAYHVKNDDAEFYKVVLKKGDEKQKVKMKPSGKLYKKDWDKAKETDL